MLRQKNIRICCNHFCEQRPNVRAQFYAKYAHPESCLKCKYIHKKKFRPNTREKKKKNLNGGEAYKYLTLIRLVMRMTLTTTHVAVHCDIAMNMKLGKALAVSTS